ncbi:MAG: AAA family ATPase [Candidatus Delongbacteria bacterium]|nr:AAA family ATPase [Candidatus Delongbacteria bacterium]
MPLTESNYNCKDTDRQEIHKALGKEYETLSKTTSAQSIKLTNGLFQTSIGDKYIYRFELPKEPEKQIEADRPYSLRVDKQHVIGGIYSVTEHYAEIELFEYRGRHLPIIEIIVDLTVLIDLVDRTIVSIDREPLKYEIETINNLIRPILIESDEKCIVNHEIRADEILFNPEQKESITNSLKRNINIIWGPPGTGKTKTLQGLIAEFLAKGKKILFASNTNNAIDQLLEPFVDKPTYSIINDFIKIDKIVRVGSQSNEKVKNAFSPYAISEKKSIEIKNEINNLITFKQVIESKITNKQIELKKFEKYLELKSEIKELEISLFNLPTPEELQKRIQIFESSSQLLFLLIKSWKESFQYSVIKLEKNSLQLLKVIQQKQGLNIRVSQSENNQLRVSKKKAEILKSIKSLKNNLIKRLFSNDLKLLEEQLFDISNELTTLERNIQIEKNQINEITLREAELIATLSNEAKAFLSVINKINLNDCYEALKMLNLVSLLNQNSVKELQKLKKDFDFISENLVHQINFIIQISTITNEDVNNAVTSGKERITQVINSLEYKKNTYTTQIIKKENELKEFSDIENIPTAYWNNIKFEIEAFTNDIFELNKKIDKLKDSIKTLSSQIIKEAQLLCSTLVKASYDELILNCRFDVLIVDEVSMVSIPQLYCAASITKEKIILSGDHLQLQPICQSESDLAIKWLASSYFGFIEGYDNLRNNNYKFNVLDGFLSKLSEQRRMPVDISQLIKPWYLNAGNPLRDEYNNRKNVEFIKKIGNHFFSSPDNIYIFETKELRTFHNRTEDRSPYNFINAVIVSELLRELIEDYNIPQEFIRCISPYRAQYQLTHSIFCKLIHNKEIKINKSLISNVHQTQGGESEIVIYDLTDGSQGRATYFIKTHDFFIHNVAISRSKAKIIFVGDTNKLDELKQNFPDSAFGQIFQKIKLKAKIIDAKPYKERVFRAFDASELLNENSFIFTDDLKDKLTIIPSSLYFKILHQDLLKANENIIIISPFITTNRWNKLRPMFTNLLESNPDFKVEILSKPPEKMFGDNKSSNMAVVKVLNDFLDLGFKVKTSEKIHSKLIVIDRGTEKAICYIGSLNPLSFNNTDEINIRLVDMSIAEQLIRMSLVGKIQNYQKQSFRKSNFQKDIKESVKFELNQFKWVLAGFYHYPIMLFRSETFNFMLENPPFTDNEFRSVPSINSPNNVLFNHLDQLREILFPLYEFKSKDKDSFQQDLF